MKTQTRSSTDSSAVALLRAEVRYAREKRDLYRAKSYGPRPTRPARLRELERDYERAAERLQLAERKESANTPTREETP